MNTQTENRVAELRKQRNAAADHIIDIQVILGTVPGENATDTATRVMAELAAANAKIATLSADPYAEARPV